MKKTIYFFALAAGLMGSSAVFAAGANYFGAQGQTVVPAVKENTRSDNGFLDNFKMGQVMPIMNAIGRAYSTNACDFPALDPSNEGLVNTFNAAVAARIDNPGQPVNPFACPDVP